MYKCHVLFVHSSISGHLGCFHLLTPVNSVAMKMGLRISLWEPAFYSWDIHSEMELLDYTVVLFLIFFRTLYTVFHGGSTTLQATNSVQEFQFLHIHANICCLISPHPYQHLSFCFLRVAHFNHFKVYSSFRRNSLLQKNIGECLWSWVWQWFPKYDLKEQATTTVIQ